MGWLGEGGSKSKVSSLCSKNEAAQVSTPPQNDEFCIKWHKIEKLSICDWVGACAASFFEQRL